MGAETQKAGREISDPLKNLKNHRPAESLNESYFIKGWRNQGICNNVAIPDCFFVADKAETAKVVCGFCPVQQKCLIWALVYKEEGLWGGTTEEEREKFTLENKEYVESLISRAKKLKKWFPLPSVREIIDLSGLNRYF